MKTSTPSLEYFGDFIESFRIQVHQLLAWGYEDAIKKIRISSAQERQEPAITGFITNAIKERLRIFRRPSWCKYYYVSDDPPVEKLGKSGRSRPRADIIIEANWRGRPEYVFEAKRLCRPQYHTTKYVNLEGMGCFINGLYASRYSEAAMLGYVQSDSPEYWYTDIKQTIESSPQGYNLISLHSNVVFASAFHFEWKSEHDRSTIKRPITIYHILLDCRSSPL